MAATQDRTKTNFMINNTIMLELKVWIPQGKRSDFVNEAIEMALSDYKKKKAFSAIKELKEQANLTLSNDDILKLKNHGRT